MLYICHNKNKKLNINVMKAPFTVKQVVKFGMLFGYKIVDADGKDLGYEFDETEKDKADTKCELKNALNGF